jgi:hypothetical protein
VHIAVKSQCSPINAGCDSVLLGGSDIFAESPESPRTLQNRGRLYKVTKQTGNVVPNLANKAIISSESLNGIVET